MARTYKLSLIDSVFNRVSVQNSASELKFQAVTSDQANVKFSALKITAEAEKVAASLRGQAVASFREEVAKGMSLAAKELEGSSLDANMILFTMWTETMKHVAENGKGNILFFDGSVDGMQRAINQINAIQQKK